MKEKIKGFSDPRLVGREVYVRERKGVVVAVSSTFVDVLFDTDISTAYHDGRFSIVETIPSLSFTPYAVTINENGQVIIKGYSDEIELESEDKPKVGEFYWFWSHDKTIINYIRFYLGFNADNFSKTCPDWIKEIVNK